MEGLNLEEKIEEAETKAWAALASYKFIMFGYWAAIWVHLNRMSGTRKANPFRDTVKLAKTKKKGARP